MADTLAFVIVLVCVPLVLNEIGELSPWLARRLLTWGARYLGGEADVERYEEEWLADLEEVPGKLTKLGHSLVIVLWSVPVMRWQFAWRQLRHTWRLRRWSKLVARWTPTVWHVARGRGLPAERAEEVVHAVWSQYLRSRFDPWRFDVRVGEWLVMRTRDVACDMPEMAALQPQSPLNEHDAHLWAAFTTLPQDDQERLRLSVLVGRMSPLRRRQLGAVAKTRRAKDTYFALGRLRQSLAAARGRAGRR